MNRKPLILIAVVLTALFGCGTKNKKQHTHLGPPDYTVRLEVVAKHWDGEFNWTQARVAAIPGMGNFGVSHINSEETWVTVGENMHPPENLNLGADGSVFAARIFWSSPDKNSNP